MQNTNKEMPDFSKSFKFSYYDRVYEYSPSDLKHCTVTHMKNCNTTKHEIATVRHYIDSGLYKVITEEQTPSPTLLDRLKSFTTLTGASIFIQPDGEYEVYYDDPFMPATAKSDEEMSKLIDAITVLHVATYGE